MTAKKRLAGGTAFAIAGVVLTATVGCAAGCTRGAPEPPRFTLPADPAVPVITLMFQCGDCLRRITYTLTSDGGLVRILSEVPGQEVRTEKVLSQARTQEVVALLVNRGIMRSSNAKIERALRDQGGAKLVADGGYALLEVHLASLEEGWKRTDNPSIRLTVDSLGAQYHAYKDIPEITGMQLVYEEFKKEVG